MAGDRMIVVVVFVLVVFLRSALSSPVAVQTSGSILDDHSQKEQAESFDAKSEKASAGSQLASGFSQENEKKHAVAQDSGSFSKENNDRNQHQDAGERFGEQFHRENAGSLSNFGRQGGHRKGHKKSGYQNTHHKEESENNNSFYDDSDDQGGHFVYDSRDGAFGSAGGDRSQGSYSDGSLYAKGNAQRGVYNTGGNFDRAKADQSAFNQRQFYDNKRNQGNYNAGQSQGEAGRHAEDRYYSNQPQYNKYQPRRTITVYEDPRDFDRGWEYYGGYQKYPQYEPRYDDLAQSDFKRNPLPYYPKPFDYYY